MEKIENGSLIGSLNGTIVGGAGLVAGIKGLALHINGVDQYVDFGYQGDTCLGHFYLCPYGWTTAFWVKITSVFNVVMSTGATTAAGQKGVCVSWVQEIVAVFVSGKKQWRLFSPTYNHILVGWTHVVLTWRPYSGAQMFNNGTLEDTHEVPDTISNNFPEDDAPFLVGSFSPYGGIFGFEGYLDELRIWNTALCAEEVSEMFTTDIGLN